MPALPALRRLLAPLAGVAAALGYLLTPAHQHPPDALAYAAMVTSGDLFHPQHLLHNVVGVAAVGLQGWLRPDASPLEALCAVNALAGGLGVGLLVSLGLSWGLRPAFALAVAALLAASQGWWTLSTTWEVHVLPVALVLLALKLLSGEGRGLWGGVVLGLAVLLHKTMILVFPAIAIGRAVARGGIGAAARPFAIASLLVGLGYGGVWVAAVGLDGAPAGPTAENLLKGEMSGGEAVAGSGSALLRGAMGALSVAEPGPCAVQAETEAEWQGVERARRIVGVGAVLGLLAATAGILGWLRERPFAASVALGWPLVAIPAIYAFEPENHEYYLGPMAVLLLAAGRGMELPVRRSSTPGTAVGLVTVVVLAAALLLGRQTWSGVVAPGMEGPQGVTCRRPA